MHVDMVRKSEVKIVKALDEIDDEHVPKVTEIKEKSSNAMQKK